MVKAPGHSSPSPRRYQFPLWGTSTHHALHAFMVLVALWSSCSPRGSITSNNPPVVKLYPPCLRPLATCHHLPRDTCSHFKSPLLPSNTHKTLFRCRPIVDGSNDDDNATLGQGRHAARRQHHDARRMPGDETFFGIISIIGIIKLFQPQ